MSFRQHLQFTGLMCIAALVVPGLTAKAGLMGPVISDEAPLFADDILQFDTYGQDQNNPDFLTMADMKVTAFFSNGTSNMGIWDDSVGKASGAGWELIQTGHTFDYPEVASRWTLNHFPTVTTRKLTRLKIEAWAGDVVFDRVASHPANSTPGSAEGRSVTLDGSDGGFSGGNVTAAYRRPVGVGGNAPVGDLYGELDLFFGSGGLESSGQFRFWADTDNALNVVPEPGAGLLCLTICGVGFLRRRRRS